MNPAEYESLVADICEQMKIHPSAHVQRHRKLVGQSGQPHDIDVAIEVKEPFRLLFLVECKWWNTRVSAEEVMVLIQRVKDTGAHKGIIVTKLGFQAGAVRMAIANGVALVICRRKKFEFVNRMSVQLAGLPNDDDDYDFDNEMRDDMEPFQYLLEDDGRVEPLRWAFFIHWLSHKGASH